MKILHLTNIIGEHKGGGVHEVVANFYREQRLMQHEPHIWYPGYSSDADSIRLDGNIKRLSTIGSLKYGVVKDLFKSIPKDVEDFDIIHQHGVWMPMSIYAKKIKKYTKLKSIVQPHGYLEPFQLENSKYKKKLAFSLFEKSNILAASALIACSINEGKKLKKMFPDKDIAIIPNGISLDFISHKSLSGNLRRKKRMLFLSQIIPIKGLERLFKVMAHIGVNKFYDWEFLIAGYNDTKYTRLLSNIIQDLNLEGVVKFVGPMLGEDKVRIFDNSDVFILPTYSENFGIVVAEALARGVPVITTKGAPWEELSTDRCGYWVDNTEEGLKMGMMRLLSTPSRELKEMGLRGKKLIKNKYLWEDTTVKTIQLYEWILKKAPKPDFII